MFIALSKNTLLALETIKLKYEDSIKALENCPSNASYDGDLVLYRCVGSPLSTDCFMPHAMLKDVHKKHCDRWGLSVYKDLEAIKSTLKSLAKRTKGKYSAIATCTIKNGDGIKYQSSVDKNHYTFFPTEDFDCVSKFKIIEKNE